MRSFLSGIDLFCVIKELSLIKGSKIKKLYHINDELLIHLYHKDLGSPVIRVVPGKLIHLTSFKKEAPISPSHFCMYLRKYLLNTTITSITQHGLERVVELVLQGDKTYRLIFELFSKGNVVITDANYKILQCLSIQKFASRIIKPMSIYSYPPKELDLSSADFVHFKGVIKRSDKVDLVRALAITAGLGGAYAEELILRTGVDKESAPIAVPESDLNKVFSELLSMLRKIKYLDLDPRVVIKSQRVYDVVPFKFMIYDKFSQKSFSTFNEALDYFYVKSEREAFEFEKQRVLIEKQEAIKSSIQKQENHLIELRDEAEQLRAQASLIRDNLDSINNVFNSLLRARDNGYSWNDINEMILKEKGSGSPEALLIKDFRLADKTVVLNLGDGLAVSLDSKPSDLMVELFEKAKKLESKFSGTEQSINDLKAKLDSLTVDELSFEKNVPKPIAYKTGAWFEDYRWFKSSEGFLVVGGRNADQNEELYSKHLDPEDLVFHADIQGAALVVVKKGRDAGEATINQAAQFAACHSKAWSMGISVDVYYANPYQFTKSSDVLLAKGSFIVKGKKNYVSGLQPVIYLGIELVNELTYRLISGPRDAVRPKTKHFIKIVPGELSASEVSKEVREFFKTYGYSINLDDVHRALPSGKFRVERKA